MIRFQQAAKSSHKFKVGQHVRMPSRFNAGSKTVEFFTVKATLPVKDGSPQYRIRSDIETHDRVTTEDTLEDAESAST